jgi:hypothetical protein
LGQKVAGNGEIVDVEVFEKGYFIGWDLEELGHGCIVTHLNGEVDRLPPAGNVTKGAHNPTYSFTRNDSGFCPEIRARWKG